MDQTNSFAPVVQLLGARASGYHGLHLEGAALVSENDDPWIAIDADRPVSFIALSAELSTPAAAGDVICIYLADAPMAFCAERALAVPMGDARTVKRVLCLDAPARYIRFDPAARAGALPFAAVSISCHETAGEAFAALHPELQGIADGRVVVTHAVDNTGAPILAFNIAQALAARGRTVATVCLACEEGALCRRYEAAGLALIPLDLFGFMGPQPAPRRLQVSYLARALYQMGFRSAILNTIVSAGFAGSFKQAGFRVTALVHETAHTIHLLRLEGNVHELALFADVVVSPTRSVQEDLCSIAHRFAGRLVVRPQGVYLSGTPACEERADALLDQLGVHPTDTIVLGSGTAELRKGIDLFISAAAAAHGMPGGEGLVFLWFGDYPPTALASELGDWLALQVGRTGLGASFQIVPFADAATYKAVLARSAVFWSTSRDDTFPSVVLEAMDAGVPVMAFAGASGVDTMLADGRGVLVPDFSVAALAGQTLAVLSDAAARGRMTADARRWVREELDFGAYVQALEELAGAEPVVAPADAASMLPENEPLPCNPPLGSVVPEEALKRPTRQKKGLSAAGALKRALGTRPSRRERGAHPGGVPVLLDVAAGSDNIGDQIIMDHCVSVCAEVFGTDSFERVSTHVYDARLDQMERGLKIVCGTNLIYTHMEDSVQWAFPHDLGRFDDLCLLGVGMQDLRIDEPFSPYSVELLHRLLDGPRLHAVRDAYTAERLRGIGIENVVNTACPTMWGLTPERCARIPAAKGRAVVATLTDYACDPAADKLLLDTLLRAYEQVYLWIQGRYDYDLCIKGVVDPTAVKLVPRSLAALDEVLSQPDVDYVGTRLHAGIRALNHGRRTVVVAVDNRARHIAADTGLPVIERADLARSLEAWIEGSAPTRIALPTEQIERWKAQFTV